MHQFVKLCIIGEEGKTETGLKISFLTSLWILSDISQEFFQPLKAYGTLI